MQTNIELKHKTVFLQQKKRKYNNGYIYLVKRAFNY